LCMCLFHTQTHTFFAFSSFLFASRVKGSGNKKFIISTPPLSYHFRAAIFLRFIYIHTTHFSSFFACHALKIIIKKWDEREIYIGLNFKDFFSYILL
jgi:hypothetical protein